MQPARKSASAIRFMRILVAKSSSDCKNRRLASGGGEGPAFVNLDDAGERGVARQDSGSETLREGILKEAGGWNDGGSIRDAPTHTIWGNSRGAGPSKAQGKPPDAQG